VSSNAGGRFPIRVPLDGKIDVDSPERTLVMELEIGDFRVSFVGRTSIAVTGYDETRAGGS